MGSFIKLKNHNWFLTITAFLIQLIGIIVIYSATFNAKTLVEGAGLVNRQIAFLFLGFFLYFFVSFINLHYFKFRIFKISLFIGIVLLLIYVLIFGDSTYSTNRWIEWGFIRIQPSEYSKIVLIILLSSILSSSYNFKKTKNNLFQGIKSFFSKYPIIFKYILSIIISLIIIILIVIEPALGTSLIVLSIVLFIMIFNFPNMKWLLSVVIILLLLLNCFYQFFQPSSFLTSFNINLIFKGYDILFIVLSILLIILITLKARLKLFIVGFLILLTLMTQSISRIVWNNLTKYQKDRIEAYFNPDIDPNKENSLWQITQSRITIGSGRLIGKNFLQGSQTKFRLLPESYSDFVFAAYCEEFGLTGAILLLSLYLFLLITIMKIAISSSSSYETSIGFGVLMMILIHIFINISMNLGIIPVTGIPLPLVSYGGSSIMVTMIGLGLVQSINIHRKLIDNSENLMVTSKVYDLN